MTTTISIVIWAFAILLFVAVDRKALDAGVAALLFVSAAGTLIAAAYALGALRSGEGIGVSSHWGGLGGGLGGWRLTPATPALLLALIFFGASVAIGLRDGGPAGNDSSTNRSTNMQADADSNDTDAAAGANEAATANEQANAAGGAGEANNAAEQP
jgi:hypothetical protein